jgi:uncharacterized protein
MPDAQDDVLLIVQVHPRSKRETAEWSDDILHIWVHAPPVEGAANDAVIAFLARRLAVPRRHITMARGATSRHKQIRISGLTREEILSRLSV